MLFYIYFIVLLPITLYMRKYFVDGVLQGFIKMARAILFGSSFSASWYIQATIFGTCIIYILSKKLSNRWLLVVSTLIYFGVCIRSSYLVMFGDASIIKKAFNFYELFLGNPVFMAPSAMIWITLGKCFADNFFVIKKKKIMILLVTFVAFLYAEWSIVKFYTGNYNNDCYFLLIPVTICIFMLVVDLKLKPIPLFSRISSILAMVYTTHIPVSMIISFFIKKVFHYKCNMVVFLMTIIVCITEGMIVLHLEKYKYFRWLRYIH